VAARRNQFLYAGTVEATTVELSSRVMAVIGAVNVNEGDQVKGGDVLVKLSGDDVRVAAEQAERDYKRAVQLLAGGSMDQESYDRIKFKRDDANVRLGWCTIYSPIDGTVITRYHEPGEMVTPGTKLLMLEDLSKVWAYIYVAHDELAKLKAGMNVDGLVAEANMKTIPGTIVKINEDAEFTPKNVQTRKERTRLVYGVKVNFNNPDRFLKPGMTVEIKLPD
jgi:HlyD family secretion protein